MPKGHRRAAAALAACVALAAAACSQVRIVNTGETPAPTTPAPTTVAPPASNANLVNAFDYYAASNDQPGYYFTTPSGKWRCAIIARTRAGCQSATNSQSGIGIPGQPDAVSDNAGQTKPPNAIEVEYEGDAHFAAVGQSGFSLVPGPAKTLPFNKILAAAGFRCNVQDSGVSCLSEETHNGFTFSAAGYTPTYTDVPAPR